MTSEPDAICDLVIAMAGEWEHVAVGRTEHTTSLHAGGVEFAELEPRHGAVDLYLTLPGGHRVPGIVKLLTGGGDVSRYRLRLRRVADVDAEVRAWLREAYEGATTPRT